MRDHYIRQGVAFVSPATICSDATMANCPDRPTDEWDNQRQQTLEVIAGDIRGSLEQILLV